MDMSYVVEMQHWSSYVAAVQQKMKRGARGPGYGAVLAWLALVVAFVVAMPWLVAYGFGPEHALSFSVGTLAAWLLLTSYLLRWQRHTQRRGLKADGIVLGPKTLTVGDDGLVFRGSTSEQVYRWDAVEGVEVYKDIVIVWFEPVVGSFMPASAFGGEEGIAAFCREIDARRTTAIR
ncbi:MAG TPA: YcxB family protein [Hyphomicrobiaceae bacterium]|nr:YcxB family protein [Hyphomicrobiaceae bacterium]